MTDPDAPLYDDDTICAWCGRPLTEDPAPGTPAYDGFCDALCREDYEAACVWNDNQPRQSNET